MDKTLAYWDDHTDKVSRRSSQWASSDRGWLFASREAQSSAGSYLDYSKVGHCANCSKSYANCECKAKGKTVHAVVYRRVGGEWFATVEEAKAWIEEESEVRTAQPA